MEEYVEDNYCYSKNKGENATVATIFINFLVDLPVYYHSAYPSSLMAMKLSILLISMAMKSNHYLAIYSLNTSYSKKKHN